MEKSYPLEWPDDWEHIPPEKQQAARTSEGFTAARDYLLNELRLLGAKDVVVSCNIRVDRSGMAMINEERFTTKDPGAAVYFNLGDARYAMAADDWDHPRANIRALGATIGYIRAMGRSGSQQSMEKCLIAFTKKEENVKKTDENEQIDEDLPKNTEKTFKNDGYCAENHKAGAWRASDSRFNNQKTDAKDQKHLPTGWWDVLDVPSEAPLEVIEAAYHKLARAYHPDAGGSEQQMSELNVAIRAARESKKGTA